MQSSPQASPPRGYKLKVLTGNKSPIQDEIKQEKKFVTHAYNQDFKPFAIEAQHQMKNSRENSNNREKIKITLKNHQGVKPVKKPIELYEP